MIDINELRRKLCSDDLIDHVDIHANVKPVLTELLDRLEAEESKQAALLDCLNEWKELAKSAEKERDALRAKVAAMEKQEPECEVVGQVHNVLYEVRTLKYDLPVGTKLYALPGAKGE